MSRLLVSGIFILIAAVFPAYAQQLSQAEIDALIEKQRRMVAVDDEGCIKYPVDDEIVVCGTPRENKRQKLPLPHSRYGPGDRIPGEALSTTHLGGLSAPGGIAFGYVPPPAIPFEEVMRGLPDQDMVVPEGDSTPPPANPQ